jgi:hypothetical protein
VDGNIDAHLFALLCTLRIIQLNGLAFSTGKAISPLRAGPFCANQAPIFISFRELCDELPIPRFP